MVVREGFEPSKAEPADLQSAPFGRSGTSPHSFEWCRLSDSNQPPADYKSAALPDELKRHNIYLYRQVELMAEVTRLELATSCVTGKHSNQLSYTSKLMENLYNVCVAALAHLVEQLTCNQQVVGSSPTSGTSLK